jgi:hypothetical protein
VARFEFHVLLRPAEVARKWSREMPAQPIVDRETGRVKRAAARAISSPPAEEPPSERELDSRANFVFGNRTAAGRTAPALAHPDCSASTR